MSDSALTGALTLVCLYIFFSINAVIHTIHALVVGMRGSEWTGDFIEHIRASVFLVR